jgi:serine/threonine-protein kinase
MIRCPRCQKEINEDAPSCPSCGLSFDEATRQLDSRESPAKDPGRKRSTSAPSFDSIDDSRFVPGTILAERYRIVGLLGRGGMGEVYRADDLKLGQPVALKFLPEHLLTDGAALARFHREVRVARQVSHKNVCRVYDIGEVDGRHFLSMEFIKGEELSSLLHRIGRLPQDKAVQIARQICAGLAAAHDVGVLHRDLKPSNVMIDEHGNARITDFGLAGLAEEFREDEIHAGTPAYMAPEQLDGRKFTVRSDIYSLGLVLYELFTGRKAFEAPTLGELVKLRRSDTTPTTPSEIIKGLDPLIEKVIDRCLRKDPEDRPSSALQVAAALPGGDPIAAALAAGETPSPEMVAAAPKEGALKPAIAAGLLVSFLVLLALCCWLTKYTAVYRMAALDQSPEVLRAHAKEIIKQLGYTDQPADTADGFILKKDYLHYIAARDQSRTRWNKLREEGPGPYRYWYRQSPRYFETIDPIAVDRPALDVSGMTSVYLDTEGRLHWFIGVPPQREPEPKLTAPDWSLPFHLAGLDLANFHPVASTSVPLHAYDARAAWDGADPIHPDLKTHVEAAAFHGKLIYFETVYPWDGRGRQELPSESGGQRALTVSVIAVFMIVLVGSVLVARRNLRQGRGDRRGAARVAVFFFIVRMSVWLFAEHHSGLLEREFTLFFLSVARALFEAAFLWVLYVALEPFIRRRWPDRIISWSRLLAGSIRDPLVGRDLLLGAVFGAAMILCTLMSFIELRWIGQPPELAINPGSEQIGAHLFFAKFASQITAGLFLAFFAFFMLLLFVVILRRERPALIPLWLLILALSMLVMQANLMMIPVVALDAFIFVFVLYRYGLLALAFALFVNHLWVFFPITSDFTAWYATDFIISLVICIALAGYGFYISLGGQPVFKGGLLPE